MELAERTGGVVINADSAQVYADLRVLSARPSTEDEARVPHRLFGYIDGAESCSAARWAADTRGEIAAAHAAGRLPVLVGGTGLYLRTLIDGIAPVPEIDPAIRADVRAMPVAAAHHALQEADPAAAARLAAADTTRVARALEVVRSTGRTLAAWQDARTGGIGGDVNLVATILIPDRDWLLARCDARLEAMFGEGAIEEVARLLTRDDIPVAAPIRRAIGVPEIAAMLAGDLRRDAALAAAKVATRQYAKRQYTWFRNQPPTTWLRTSVSEKDIIINQIEIRLRD